MTDVFTKKADEALEKIADEILEMDPASEEYTKAVKNLETLTNCRVSVYQAKEASYEADIKLQTEDEKNKMEKRNMIVTWGLNGLMAAFYVVSYVWLPRKIMNANREGEFFDRDAIRHTDKPKPGFFKSFRK